MKYDYKENVSVIEMVNFLDEAGPEGFEVIRSTNKGVTFIYWWDDDFDNVKMKLANLSPMLAGSNGTISISTQTEQVNTKGEFFKAIFRGGDYTRYGYEVGKSYLIFCQIIDNMVHVKPNGRKDEYAPMDYVATSLKQFISEWEFTEDSLLIKPSTD